MRRVARRAAAVSALAAAALAASPGSADTPPGAVPEAVPEAARGWTRSAALALATAGRPEEAEDAVTLLAELGADGATLANLREQCGRLAAKVAAPSAAPDAARALRSAALSLVSAMPPAAKDETRTRFARLAVALDSECVPAHDELGDSKIGDRWYSPEQARTYRRRAEIASAIAEARHIPVATTQDRAADPLLRRVLPDPGARTVWRGVELHSDAFSQPRMARILEKAVRAMALSRKIRVGKLEAAAPALGVKLVLWGSPELRPKVIDALVRAGRLKAEDAEDLRAHDQTCFDDNERAGHVFTTSDAAVTSYVAYYVWAQLGFEAYEGDPKQCLLAGHLDCILRELDAGSFPRLGWGQPPPLKLDPASAELHALTQRGMTGVRRWVERLARRGEDAPWSQSLHDDAVKIVGDQLLKSSSFTEFLHETGSIDQAFRGTTGQPASPASFQLAIGGTLDALEGRWRSWVLGCDEGLAQRAGRGPAGGGTTLPAEQQVLARLDAIRAAAVLPAQRAAVVPLRLDEELSSGCRAHGAYLARNPEAKSKWPDVAREVDGRPAFTVEGCRAAWASVVLSPATSPDDAIDGWMATFRDRLPLLDAGARRIGFALAEGSAVLDATSLRVPSPGGTWCVWPPPGAKDVALQSRVEVPSPVAGEDGKRWGYPVTVQLCSDDDEPKLRLALTLDGKPVDAVVSTPDAPANPALVPSRAWCILPRAALRPASTYTVTVEGVPGVGRLEWTFSTRATK